MKEIIRWGILGTGNIATSFATGVASMADAQLAAVGSRSQASADAFGDRFNIPRRHPTYADLANDPDVDVIYIATPHTLHLENMLLCLDAGKAVLCEKPLTVNAAQARQAIERAQQSNLFLMEAVWMRFMPLMVKIRQMLAEGAIGQVRVVSADFGFVSEAAPESRVFDPALGGGGLLDVGIYPISLAQMILGTPTQVTGVAQLASTGIDEQSAFVFGYAGGELAVLHNSLRTRTPQEAILMGTEGWIRIHTPWWIPQIMTLEKPGQEAETIEIPYESNGYTYEAAEVHRCLRAGEVQSKIMPWHETLAVMETMDTLRAQWGLKYPME
jgi:predicted dehydrogenase